MSIPAPPSPSSSEHCYRHPTRETGRHCSRCGRPACSECLTQAAVGSHCPECVKAAQPDLKTRVKYANAKQHNLVTNVLIGINVAVFLWVTIGDTSTLGGGLGSNNAVSQRQIDLGLIPDRTFTSRGIVYKIPHHWYQYVTSGFLHFGILHIGLNMYMLYRLGQLLERSLGRAKFTLLYFAALLGGSAGVMILGGHQVNGGASGAIFGLIGAAAIATHRQGINIMQTPIGQLLVMNVVLTVLLHNEISIGAHAGGLVAGLICGAVMLAPSWKPTPKWSKYATPAVVGVVSLIVCFAIAG